MTEGEGYQRARETFQLLLGELSRATSLAAQYVGGEYTARDHKGDPDARPAMQPIPLEKQQKALEILKTEILSDQSFQFPPALLKSLAPEHLTDNYTLSGSYHYPVYDRVLSIQRMAVTYLLNPDVLKNVLEIELHAEKDEKVLTLPDIFTALTDSIWSELPAEAPVVNELKISTIRRNLQRTHVQQLSDIVLGGSSTASTSLLISTGNRHTADARSLARMELQALSSKIDATLKLENVKPDAYTKAHLQDIQHQLNNVLSAGLIGGRP